MKKKPIRRKNSFVRWQAKNWKEDMWFPPELEPQDAIKFLKDYLLGEDWRVVDPMNDKEYNVCVVDAILATHSKEYRKEVKRYRKRLKRNAKYKRK